MEDITVFAVRHVCYDVYEKQNLHVSRCVICLADKPTFPDIQDLTSETVQMYIDEEIDELNIIYNKYISAISQTIDERQLLPIVDIKDEDAVVKEYEYEPEQEYILNLLLPQYAESLIYGAILDAKR